MNAVQQEEQRIKDTFRLRALDSLRLGGLQDLAVDLRTEMQKTEYANLLQQYKRVL